MGAVGFQPTNNRYGIELAITRIRPTFAKGQIKRLRYHQRLRYDVQLVCTLVLSPLASKERSYGIESGTSYHTKFIVIMPWTWESDFHE